MVAQHRDAGPNHDAALPWSALAKVGAALAAVGGIAFHFLGLVGHMAYLHAWGVDSGLFPKPIDWLMTNGAAAFVDRTTVVLAAANTITGRLVAAALLFFVMLTLAFRVVARQPARPDTSRAAPKAGPWTRSIGFGLASTFSAFAAVPIAMFLFTTLIVFPWVMGETYGAAATKRERAIFNAGCQAASVGYRCIEVRKGDQVLVRGFLIESSPTHSAIYDAATRRARTLPREGTELITDPLPAPADGAASAISN